MTRPQPPWGRSAEMKVELVPGCAELGDRAGPEVKLGWDALPYDAVLELLAVTARLGAPRQDHLCGEGWLGSAAPLGCHRH